MLTIYMHPQQVGTWIVQQSIIYTKIFLDLCN